MRERWRNIIGYTNYEVSTFGNVRNATTKIVLKSRKSRNGYLRVGLRTGERKYENPKTLNVHRLVAEHFLMRESDKLEVNHINGEKTDNNINNLEWVTKSQNVNHAIRLGLISKNRINQMVLNITSTEAKRKSDLAHKTPEYRRKMQKINKKTGVTKTVVQIDADTNEKLRKFDNSHEAARFLFGDKFTTQDRLISRVARGKAKSAYGYKWLYEKDVV